MQVKALYNFILFLILFQTVNRGFVPFIDLRIVILILIYFMHGINFFRDYYIKKINLIAFFITIIIITLAIASYMVHPLSEFNYFTRRFLQLFYICNIILFLIVYKKYFKLNIFKKYFYYLDIFLFFLCSYN